MGFVYVALIVLAFDVLVALFGTDSRPADTERPTRWLFPMDRQGWNEPR